MNGKSPPSHHTWKLNEICPIKSLKYNAFSFQFSEQDRTNEPTTNAVVIMSVNFPAKGREREQGGRAIHCTSACQLAHTITNSVLSQSHIFRIEPELTAFWANLISFPLQIEGDFLQSSQIGVQMREKKRACSLRKRICGARRHQPIESETDWRLDEREEADMQPEKADMWREKTSTYRK